MLIFLLLLSVFLSGCTSDVITEEVKVPETSKVQQQSQTQASQKTTSPPENLLEVKVLEKKTFESIGDDFLKETADGTFIVLTISIENKDKEPIYMWDSDVQLVDEENRKFVAKTIIFMENVLTYETINPGIKITRNVVFDVPNPDADFRLYITDNYLRLFD